MKPKINAAVELCPIVEKANIAERIVDMTVYAPKIAQKVLAPGQFLHVKCDGFTLRRPISICDISGGNIRFIFEIRGGGTNWLASRCKGDVLDILGPLGNGFEKIGGLENAIIVAGGIGAPPMLGVCKAINAKLATVLLGFKTKSSAILIDEFAALGASVKVATDDGSLGARGFVTELLKQELYERKASMILSCGPAPMLKAVARIAESYNLRCLVSMEQRMGCGVGACLVCACKTKNGGAPAYFHVCIDGPVFDSREVVWDE